MHSYRVLFLPFFAFIVFEESSAKDLFYMNTAELLQHWGYQFENHTVQTEDGYLLTIHRIPNPNSTYYPVIFGHGLLMASDAWLLRGRNEDLTLLLADEGFDIWLANYRGNYYSKRHISYKNTEKRFWQFGWNEVGSYDLPAIIEHVRNVTNREKVIHVGYSMGATTFYAMAAKRTEINEQIHAHISLAPAVYMHRMKAIKALLPFILMAEWIVQLQEKLKLYDLFSRNRRLSEFVRTFCNISPELSYICLGGLFLVVGNDYSQAKPEYVERHIGHFPSGASSGMLLHYLQNILSRDFREYNHGPELNMKKYGRFTPPAYDLKQITVPVYLYYSWNDYFVNKLDVERLIRTLPNVKKRFIVPHKYFNHLDYLWARDSKTLLYDDVISTMKTLPL